MRNRRDVFDVRDLEAHRIQCADSRFTAWAWALDAYFEILEPEFSGHVACTFSSNLCCERSRLARTTEPGTTRGRPGQGIALAIGDRDDCVVERRVNVGDPVDHRLLHTLARFCTCLCHCLLPGVSVIKNQLARNRTTRALAGACVRARTLTT